MIDVLLHPRDEQRLEKAIVSHRRKNENNANERKMTKSRDSYDNLGFFLPIGEEHRGAGRTFLLRSRFSLRNSSTIF